MCRSSSVTSESAPERSKWRRLTSSRLFSWPAKMISVFCLCLGFFKSGLHERLLINDDAPLIPDAGLIGLIGFIQASAKSHNIHHLAEFVHIEPIREMIEQPYGCQVFRISAGPCHRYRFALGGMVGPGDIYGAFKLIDVLNVF